VHRIDLLRCSRLQFAIHHGRNRNQPGDVAGQFLSPNAQIDVTDGNTAGIAFMPEPGSLTLLAMGLAGLPFLRRKLAR